MLQLNGSHCQQSLQGPSGIPLAEPLSAERPSTDWHNTCGANVSGGPRHRLAYRCLRKKSPSVDKVVLKSILTPAPSISMLPYCERCVRKKALFFAVALHSVARRLYNIDIAGGGAGNGLSLLKGLFFRRHRTRASCRSPEKLIDVLELTAQFGTSYRLWQETVLFKYHEVESIHVAASRTDCREHRCDAAVLF